MRRFEDIKHDAATLASEISEISYFYFDAMEGQGDPEFSLMDKLSYKTQMAVRELSQVIVTINDCQRLYSQLRRCGDANQPQKP